MDETADEYAKTLQSAIDLAMGNYDQDVADYFKTMHPEMLQMFGEWQFKINFEPNTEGLQDKVTNALDSIDDISDGTRLKFTTTIPTFISFSRIIYCPHDTKNCCFYCTTAYCNFINIS